jgi:hypothetical protein
VDENMGCAMRFIRACVDTAVQVRACELGLGFVGAWEECDACDARLLRGSDCCRDSESCCAIAKVRLLPGKGFFLCQCTISHNARPLRTPKT